MTVICMWYSMGNSLCLPLKKKVDLLYLTFPVIYMISYISLTYRWVSSNKHKQTFYKGTRWVSNSDPVVSAALPQYQASASWQYQSNNYIKNSAISVLAGAIYMRTCSKSLLLYNMWNTLTVTVLYEWTLAFWKLFQWFWSQMVISRYSSHLYGSTQYKYKVCLTFIIAYLDEFNTVLVMEVFPCYDSDIWMDYPSYFRKVEFNCNSTAYKRFIFMPQVH